ncbi:MAG: type II toxin-antitoxin system PemK/MazF family toxin [Faecalibacterium prausnitzii]
MEYASNERSRYHTAFSLDSEDYEGTNLVSEKTPDDLMAELENREHLLDCLAHLPSIVQAEQIFTVDKSRVLKYLGHLTPEEMSRVDDAVRASLALNPMGSIQRLPPIIRSTAAYAPPEVVDGKPPISIPTHPSNRPLRTPGASRT